MQRHHFTYSSIFSRSRWNYKENDDIAKRLRRLATQSRFRQRPLRWAVVAAGILLLTTFRAGTYTTADPLLSPLPATFPVRGDGDRIPAIGLGTWKASPGEVGAAVKEAVRCGYRHIDCASVYGNEAEVGEALRELFEEGVVTREELWITSKLWNDHHEKGRVEEALRNTLSDLGLDYLDLYLVHWPVALRYGTIRPETAEDMIPLSEIPLAETWSEMERAVDAGLARRVGVSNFSVAKLRRLVESDAVRIKPAVNQIERHPYLRQTELLEWCREDGVHVTGYSPLGSGDRSFRENDEPVLLKDETIAEIARKHGGTPAQVLLAWAVRCGTSVAVKSTSPKRLRENLSVVMNGSFVLDEDDAAKIDALDRHHRYLHGKFWVLENGPYTLENLWDE